jgi:predicted nuclease of predicted toxin-antitoxin system
MKLLFDQNISHKVLKVLPPIFVGSTSVKKEGLINAPDREIWDFAKSNGFTIVTQDSDFNDLNSLLGFPPKIIWVRTGNLTTKQIVDVLIDYFQEIELFMENDQYSCMEIVSLK